MVGEWVQKSFAEFVGGTKNIIGGPFGSNLTQADYVPQGVPIIRGSNMAQVGRYIGGNFAYVTPNKAEALASNQVVPGDIVVTQRGTMGQVSIVPPGPHRRYVVSQSQMGVHVEGNDPLFVFYLLKSPRFAEYLNGATIQTGVPHINMGILRNWQVTVPSRGVQEEIAGVLSALDDKIELNWRIAKTLETKVRALFKSWFVDFDPVRAKGEGRPIGLSDDLAALFPDNLGADGLPAGWVFRPISDLFEVRGGNTPRTENYEYWNGNYHWATPKDLSGLAAPVLTETDRMLTETGLEQVSSGLLPSGSLLLSTRAPIGYMAFTAVPTAINQGFAGLVRLKTTPAYAWAWCDANINVLTGNAGGSTFPEISKAVLRQLPMLAPPQSVLDAFGEVADGLVARMVVAAKENQTLVDLRDTLLPKLISGEQPVAFAGKRIVAA